MIVSRRTVLKLALATAVQSVAPVPTLVSRAYAAPGAGGAKFLLVFLRGGYDAINVVAPVGSDFYHAARPTLALPRPDAANSHAALPLGEAGGSAAWGLHPALKDTLYSLWQGGQLAFVPFAGTTDLTRSHFETQDSVERGLPLAGGRNGSAYGSGFLNRLAAALDGAAAPVAFTDNLPIAMTGDIVVPNVSLAGDARASFDDRQLALLTGMYRGTRFEPLITEGFSLRKTVAEQAALMAQGGVENEMQAASRRALSARGFELEARRMAGLMRNEYDIGFIDVGGWDTHVNQGGSEGRLANLLESLGRGLAAFVEHMGPIWSNTVVVVLSEFGRTFRENGTKGTDHGHGSVYWVLGGAVHGGRLAGEQVSITAEHLNQNRDWPVLTDYRALLGGLFTRMYGLDAARIDRVFPGTAPLELALL